MVRSLSQADPYDPDQIDLRAHMDQTAPSGVDGSDMLAKTNDPFSGNSDFNRLVVDAIPDGPEADFDADIASQAQRNVEDVISEVNRILGEE
jgi:hypothetical protein